MDLLVKIVAFGCLVVFYGTLVWFAWTTRIK